MFEGYRGYFPNVHPTAWVHATAVVLGDVTLAAGANIWPTVVLRGDQGAIVIGEHSNIQDGSVAHATGGLSKTTIGARVTVGHRAILHGCTVEDDCLIGMGSIVLDNAHIEPWCIIGAGAIVPAGVRIPSGSLVLGMPGRVVRQLSEEDRERIRIGCRVYSELSATYAVQSSSFR